MALNIRKELAALKQKTVPDLRGKYAETFGESTTSRHKQFLIRRILWRLQANEEGGLSERARRRAKDGIAAREAYDAFVIKWRALCPSVAEESGRSG